MQKKARPKFDYSRTKLAAFSVFAQNVVKSLTGNIHFQNPPHLQALRNAVNRLNASIIESANGDLVKIAIRQADRKEVEHLLKDMAGWLMGVSADREILMTSGMEIAKTRGPSTLLSAPQYLKYFHTPGKAGIIKLRWKQPASHRAASFVIEQKDYNSDIWRVIGYSKKCRFTASGLTLAKTYSWRVYGIGSLGPGAKSLPVSAMVI